jgi:hypothetical protein
MKLILINSAHVDYESYEKNIKTTKTSYIVEAFLEKYTFLPYSPKK